MAAHLHPLRGTAIPRLLIIGDIALFRDGIENGLARTGQFHIVGSVDVREALEIVRQEEIDVVVLDTSRRRASSQARPERAAHSSLGCPVCTASSAAS